MTRDEFDQLFLKYYDDLRRYATRLAASEGPDLVHKTYAHICENDTYQGIRHYKKRWLYYKVRREISRYRRSQRVRKLAEQEGHQQLVEGMEDRE